ncbi:MAG: hypothetical protein PVF17_13415 [Ignavibacteria bacterium]|jgi:hypothetical protein
MKNISSFKAVYTGGFIIPDAKAVTSLSLLFEKIYLPINIEFIKEFSKKYRLEFKRSKNDLIMKLKITDENGYEADPFQDMEPHQKENALDYLMLAEQFSMYYFPLYEEVFETNAYKDSSPLTAKMIKKGRPGKDNLYEVKRSSLILTEGDKNNIFNELIEKDYIPIASNLNLDINSNKIGKTTIAKTLASLLAMKSIELILPEMKAVHPEIILEARNKLSNHLPPFWSSMLKLSVELKKCLKDCQDIDEFIKEGMEMIDTTVRPALIDLNRKIELEKRNWFYKILEPLGKGIRILIGHPGLTIQELMTSSLLMTTEIASSTIDNMRIIDRLKNDSGLTYLMELNKIVSKNA